MTDKKLHLSFHGRIIDHLGIQMYQSPVAAIAEMISNAWDADAESVAIRLPEDLDDGAVITVADNGMGMTFEDCEGRYLTVGVCRREGGNERTVGKGRQVLGRKGIGKFAGFGIAERIVIDTTSGETGEHTRFALDINELRQGGYVDPNGREIGVLEYDPPDSARIAMHGTVVTLEGLTIARRPSSEPFARSMARRFLLAQRAADFEVSVNDDPLPTGLDLQRVEYSFPRDYEEGERPSGLVIADDWGEEVLSSGDRIRWQILFYEEPINDDDFRGISVFARGKLAQRPFFFNLSGGLSGQHGQQYMSGQIEADYIEDLPKDLIATERQRVNWEDPSTQPLETWGQDRVRALLGTWRDRRGEARRRQIEDKLATFSGRLSVLPPSEQRTVKRALGKLGGIPALSDEQFEEIGEAVLLAWEQGRLRGLIDDLAEAEDLSESALLNILVEAQVLTALNAAEAIKTKIDTVHGLRERIQRRELETAVRDYIARNPWLISPKWETFSVERGISGLLEDAAEVAQLDGPDWVGRVDLALSAGEQLLVLEFMRPGLRVDWDHIQRFERYVRTVRTRLRALTGQRLRKVSGYIVADVLSRSPEMIEKIEALASEDMFALDWEALFEEAMATWREFLDILASRAPDDQRLQALRGSGELPTPPSSE
ncbi:MAG: ATP-binding protein [Thermoleophilia bacterium]